MKKIVFALLLIFTFAGYVIYVNGKNSSTSANPQTVAVAPQSLTTTPAPTPVTSSTPSTSISTTTKTPTPAPAPTPTPAPKPKSLYTDGQYTGSSVDAYYGNVQVQVTISGGKITNVAFLSYPNDRSTSRFINSQAMPILQQEAIQAQSASVDAVSGASDTSQAFVQSLASALNQAKS